MKILLCHNFYQQAGGEDQVFEDEGLLLESRGHDVIRYTLHNDTVDRLGKLALIRKTLWNQESAKEIQQIIRRTKPDLMHCTNVFPLISPAAYYVAKEENVAVVQTLHNYRTICPKAQLLRDGAVCELCIGKAVAWPAIVHSCYRDDRAASAAVVAMLAFHWSKNTWNQQVDRFIALTEFSKQKHIEGGLPADKIDVKPNFVNPDPGVGTGSGDYAVFVGRLSAEKGIKTLLDGWSRLKRDLKLKIVGDGPLAEDVQRATQTDQRIEWLGRRDFTEVCNIVGDAKCLIMPSIWYETFGRTIIEAYAKGTPVIASRLGAMQELVRERRTGLLFEPGNAEDLAETVEELLSKPEKLSEFRQEVRREFELRYTSESNYDQLMAVYQRAIGAGHLEPSEECVGVAAC